ncbi:germination protein, Ger(x)C family [Caldalkalibacillus thermarum TA2.A1]|uniref:Ger(X)C family spore germination protein n=1 Tax=Caldalkalibacillus thermarum (strain TA2.A1) TaxID=986075 RepID=F5L7E9_CALTT|nr:Ger(x)C family spore germination protein [Caldalkalibacillus thermarum]EGL82741.1 germination protein, Ger(x)C family [Caldalkalibacillus thermarum TA2.A1]QZT32561.1 Ger(x)C family spore germination protein [Caldalkalibacillus thermarum TA2.A1]
MQPLKRLFCLILSAILLFSATGCWDRRDLEERVSVVAIAVDKPSSREEEHANQEYKVTIQIPVPIRIAGGVSDGGGEGGAESVNVMSSTGFSIGQAMDNLEKRLNQQLFFGHTRVIVISEEVAREGMKEIIDGFRRNPQMRRILWLLISEGKAEDVLRVYNDLEQVPIVYIMLMMENGARMGEIPDTSLGDFYISLSTRTLDPMTNYVMAHKNDVAWKGVALFKGTKMTGTLTESETWILLQLQGEAPGGEVLVSLDENELKRPVLLNPENVRTRTTINTDKGQIRAHYHVEIEAEVKEKNADVKLDDPAVLENVAQKAEEQFEKQAQELIRKLQKNYGVDALRLGLKLKAFHYKTWQQLDWEKEFPNATINVTYDVKIRRTGMQTDL